MSGKSDSRRLKPPIGAAAKAAFLAALRSGAPRHEAAAAGGYALNSFYRVARSDPAFRAGWDEAHAVSAEAERRRPEGGAEYPSTMLRMVPFPEASSGRNGEERIVSNNRRFYQRRKMRHVKFDEVRQQVFLAHFCWSCDVIAAAAEAGVCERTVYAYRRKDHAFSAEFQEALGQGYVRLEAEALRQRLAAQQRLRAAIESSPPRWIGRHAPGMAVDCRGQFTPIHWIGEGDHAQHGGGAPQSGRGAGTSSQARGGLDGEAAAEFERVMKLLGRWDRRAGRPVAREWRHGRQKRMSFDEAIVLLDKKLRALGARHGLVDVAPIMPNHSAGP